MDNMTAYRKFTARLIWTLFGSKWFSFPFVWRVRVWAYRKFFGIGKNPVIHHNVVLKRSHNLAGTISVGDNVVFGRNVFIDYSGNVVIGNNVSLAAGVHIFSHSKSVFNRKHNYQRNTTIGDNVIIYANALIMPGVKIGENTIVASGAVVFKSLPANVFALGNPAKIMKTI
jgi:acetyltransferase-like isoleucine patch superfamily enzyme